MTRAELRKQIVDAFNDDDLETLCFDLHLDYETLAGSNKSGKVRELIEHFERRRELALLLDACRRERAKLSWPDLDLAPTPDLSPHAVAPNTVVPEPPPVSPLPPFAAFTNVWVEHNVLVGPMPGMNIHAAFSVQNLRGTPCLMAVYLFLFNNGMPLQDSNGNYGTTDGKVFTSAPFTPGYDNAPYPTLTAAIPYFELHLAPGPFGMPQMHALYLIAQLRNQATGEVYAMSNPVPFSVRWP